MLPLQLLTQLRRVSKSLHEKLPLSVFYRHVCLPRRNGWSEVKQHTDLRWFYMLPPFKDNVLDFPHFRVRGAIARLAQGALRMLHYERANDGDYLVGTVQPSVSWNTSHVVYFKFTHGMLEFMHCKCRNG